MRAEPPPPEPEPEPSHEDEPPARPRTAAPFRLEDITEKLVFRFDLGYAVEQGEPIAGQPLPADVRGTRISTFGDLAAGTRGLVWAPLATYLAAHFFLDTDGAARMAAVPSVFDAAQDGRALLLRSAWGQLSRAGPRWLQPLTVRAGRQFRYGAAVAHFDGISAEYSTQPVEVLGFFGRRVALYGAGSDPFALGRGSAGLVRGGSVRLRPPGIPLTLGLEYFGFDVEDHVTTSAALDVSQVIWVRASARVRNGDLALWRAEARTRLGKTTTVAVELDDKLRDDWMYDFVVTAPATTEDDPRRWLNLGRPASRLRTALRAGTVLFGNWDVLVTAALGIPHGDQQTSFLPRYYELGTALLARFPFGIEAGIEGRVRRTPRVDVVGMIPLEDVGKLGERSFIEGTATLRYSLGARRFSAELQAFVREWGQNPLAADGVTDVAAGARFQVVGWVAEKLQLRGEYELASIPDRGAEQLGSLQSLRVLMEAIF